MGIEFVKRVASEMLGRGANAIRFNPASLQDVDKAMTRDDVRQLIKDSKVFALAAKKNKSANSKVLRKKRAEGRRRGPGRRKGTLKARGTLLWKKKTRSQRFVLKELKTSGRVANEMFKKFYSLVKGNAFPDKASMIRHLREAGAEISDDDIKAIAVKASKRYE